MTAAVIRASFRAIQSSLGTVAPARERLTRLRSVLAEVPVALESLARDRCHRLDRPQLGHAFCPEMDRDDLHDGSVAGRAGGRLGSRTPERQTRVANGWRCHGCQ